MRLHRRDGEDHRNGGVVGIHPLVAENEVGGAGARGSLGLGAQAVDGLAQAVALATHRKNGAETGDFGGEMPRNGIEFVLQQNRRFAKEGFAVRGIERQVVAVVAEAGVEAHHPPLAQRVDGRVGDLREILTEEMVERAGAAGEHGQRRVVAHAAYGLLAIDAHGVEDGFDIFYRPAGGELQLAQAGGRQGDGRSGCGRDFAERHNVLHPVFIRVLGGEQVFQFLVLVELALAQVDADEVTRPQAATLDDVGVGHRYHAGFRADGEDAVACQRIAHGTQAAAVHPRDGPFAVTSGDGSRAVPRFTDGVAEGVEVFMRLGHIGGEAPAGRHQDEFGQRQRAAGAGEDFHHRIQRAGVGGVVGDDGGDVVFIAGESWRAEGGLVAMHEVDIAFQRVDFAVMGQQTEGLRQVPGRRGVGGEALVENGVAGGEALIEQIGIEFGELLSLEQAFVDDAAAGERANVKIRNGAGAHGVFDALTHEEQLELQRRRILSRATADEDLFDFRARTVGDLADHLGAHRHLAPAVNSVAETDDLLLDNGATGFLRAEILTRQEDHADGEQVGFRHFADALQMLVEKRVRDLQVDAGTVAGLTVSINGAPVINAFEGFDAHFDDGAAGLAIDRGDEADTAGIMLVGGVVEPVALQAGGAAVPVVMLQGPPP